MAQHFPGMHPIHAFNLIAYICVRINPEAEGLSS